MKVIAPADFSFVTPLARPVERGEEIDVDDVLGAQLLEQGWGTGLVDLESMKVGELRQRAADEHPDVDVRSLKRSELLELLATVPAEVHEGDATDEPRVGTTIPLSDDGTASGVLDQDASDVALTEE